MVTTSLHCSILWIALTSFAVMFENLMLVGRVCMLSCVQHDHNAVISWKVRHPEEAPKKIASCSSLIIDFQRFLATFLVVR